MFGVGLRLQRLAAVVKGAFSGLVALFDWPGTHSLEATTGTDPTFTRATSATFEDFEGLIRTADSSEPRFQGARRVENLVQNSQKINSASSWIKSSGGAGSMPVLVSGNTFTCDPGGSAGTDYSGFSSTWSDATGHAIISRFEVSASREIALHVWPGDANAASYEVTVGPTPQILSFSYSNVLFGGFFWRVLGSSAGVNGLPVDITVTNVQIEITDGQANQNPSEYVSTGVGTGSELVTNGDFATDSDWSKGAGWTISGGVAASDGSQNPSSSALQSVNILTIGKVYEVIFTVVSRSAGSITARAGTSGVGTPRTAVGTYSEAIVCAGTDDLRMTASNDFVGSIDNVSVKEASHGANVDGVQYFNTLNGNTVASNVVTEATGSALTAANTQFGELHGAGTDYFSTPNIVTTWGELDIRARASVDSITNGYAFLANKKSAFFLSVNPTGSTNYLMFRHHLSGGGQVNTYSAHLPASVLSVRTWFRVTLDAATGDINFYTADGGLEDPALNDYAQLGTTQNVGATSIVVNGEIFTTGTFNAGQVTYPFDGEIYRTQIFNEVDGTTPVVDFTPGAYTTGSTLVSSNTGETWTLEGNATVFKPPVDADGPFGYLAEKASTNLALQSEDFTTSWSPDGFTVTANATVAPDGTTTMDRLVVPASNARHCVFQLVTTVAATNYTYSVYMKDDGAGFGGICFGFSANHISVVANLATGVVTDTEVGSASGTIVASGCDSVGNGIYRVWISGSIAGTAGYIIPFASNAAVPVWSAGRPTYTAVLGEDILIWGAQVELGTYPTSYIPTTTTTVTRNADVLTAGDMVTDAAGTAYAEASSTWATVGPSAVHVLTRGSAVLLRNVNSSSNIIWTGDGTNTSFSPTGTSYQNAPQSVASTWGSALTAYLNGSPDLTPASYDGTMGTGNLEIGMLSSAAQWDGTIRHVKIFDSELTAAEVGDL